MQLCGYPVVKPWPRKHSRCDRIQQMLLSADTSWLQFNRRVLLQSERPDFPLLERLRFLSIWARNNDEFFAVNIGRAFNEDRDNSHYRSLLQEALDQAQLAEQQYRKLLHLLEPAGLRLLHPNQMTQAEQRYFEAFLAEEVAPRTDLISARSLANLDSKALYFASGSKKKLEYLIRLPQDLPRLLPIPGRISSWVRLDELVRLRADLFLPDNRSELYGLRIIRLSELKGKEIEWEDLSGAIEKRLDGEVSHLELERDFPNQWADSVRKAVDLYSREVFWLESPLNLQLVEALVDAGPAALKFPPLTPKQPGAFLKNPWSYLDQRDLLLYHPYDDYGTVETFMDVAARDPQVTMLRATLYKLGKENRLAESLMAAARDGKDVAVVLEGRAGFDELQNLRWLLRFRGAGVKVLQLPNRKVHAKALLVRRDGQLFCHLGTGNYNPKNSRIYTDLGLFSGKKTLCNDVAAFFRALEQRQVPQLSHIHTGPAIRETLVKLILAEAHPRGQVILKFNHLTDPDILQALHTAGQNGARIDLIVRTTFTQREELFHMRSLVGRYLEHTRLAAFRAGGDWVVWASSADGMPRNIDNRYELFFPILQPSARKQMIRLLREQIRDDCNTFVLYPDGQQEALWGGKHNAQQLD